MARRNLYLLILLFISALMLSQCANPVSPEGGKKDVIPPRLLAADPPNRTTHFKAGKVELYFDEFINLKDPSTQIIVAPPTLTTTEYRVRGKNLVVDIQDKLNPNTTYNINFGSSIQDLTENNVLKNFRYVFSTGSFIDSLSLNGNVTDAFDLTPQKEVYAMLYINNNDTIPFDSLPYKVKPYYITKTNETGDFGFTHLSDQPLLLFALNDKNGNAMYDIPEEKIAFLDSLVTGYYIPAEDTIMADSVRKDTVSKTDSTRTFTTISVLKDTTVSKVPSSAFPVFKLRMFVEEDTVQKLLKKETVKEGELALYFRNPLRDGKITPLKNADLAFLEEYSTRKDTLYLWLKKPQEDTLHFLISQQERVIDTVAFPPVKAKPRRDKKAEKLSVISNMSDGTLNYFKNEPRFVFSAPLELADLTKVKIANGKDTIPVKITFTDSIHRRIVVHHNWQESTSYTLIFPDSIFYAFNGITNDSMLVGFKTRGLKDLGSLTIETSSEKQSNNYIYQLLNDKEKLIEEFALIKPGKIKFDFLSPGSYKVKVILDRNQNGKWDPGNYIKRIQPEWVFYYPAKIEIRANWDVEEKWDF
ncbi:MAG: Ig-like domain-containing protein [Syntrophothermus sp.]